MRWLGCISFTLDQGKLIGYIGPNGDVETAQYPLEIYPPGIRRFFTPAIPWLASVATPS